MTPSNSDNAQTRNSKKSDPLSSDSSESSLVEHADADEQNFSSNSSNDSSDYDEQDSSFMTTEHGWLQPCEIGTRAYRDQTSHLFMALDIASDALPTVITAASWIYGIMNPIDGATPARARDSVLKLTLREIVDLHNNAIVDMEARCEAEREGSTEPDPEDGDCATDRAAAE